MGLLINQGRQDMSKDNQFEVIIAKNVPGMIQELKLSEKFQGAIDLKIKIIGGQYNNRVVFDTVTYDPNSDFSWKYRALRKAVGRPYNPNEGAQIDIEQVLKNQSILMDLSARKDKEGNEWQQVKYLERKAQAQPQLQPRPMAQTQTPMQQGWAQAPAPDWNAPQQQVYGNEDFSHMGYDINNDNGTPEWN